MRLPLALRQSAGVRGDTRCLPVRSVFHPTPGASLEGSREEKFDQLTRQRQRHIYRVPFDRADPVAVQADAVDPRGQPPNAERPVCARPRINACTSCVPS